MLYTDFFNLIREVLAETPGIVRKFKLPPTVVKQFMEDENKHISHQNIERIARGLGLNYEIRFTNDNGEEVSPEELIKLAREKVGEHRTRVRKVSDEKTKETEAIIAGAIPVEENVEENVDEKIEEVRSSEEVTPKEMSKKLDLNSIDFSEILGI